MLQLIRLVGDVSPDQLLGYGIAGRGSVALLLALAAGVFTCIAIASGAFVLATVLVVVLVRTQRRGRTTPAPGTDAVAASSSVPG
ncbi:hypothetical protein [Goodfellowiella coeruleoviolacea]|nr:hypothetical protein [Goodfellowiella coeruleoviolacea]